MRGEEAAPDLKMGRRQLKFRGQWVIPKSKRETWLIVLVSEFCPKSFLLAGPISCCDFATSPFFVNGNFRLFVSQPWRNTGRRKNMGEKYSENTCE